MAPWGTWVAWTANGNCGGAPCGYINSINFDISDTFSNGSSVITIPSQFTPNPAVIKPIVSVGTIFDCNNSPREAVFVAWADSNGSCSYPIGTCTTLPQPVNWYWAVYDTVASTPSTPIWYGPFLLDSDGSWPACIGSPINVEQPPSGRGVASASDNNTFIPVATFNNIAVFVYDKHTSFGTRIFEQEHALVWAGSCGSGGFVDQPNPLGIFRTPDPRGGGGGGNPQTCNNNYNDEWGPQVALMMSQITHTPEVLVTWYTTREDPNNTNVAIYGGLANDFAANPFTSPFRVSIPASGQTIPWNHNLAQWHDYQSLGTDAIQSGYFGTNFLGAWGGDARLGGPTGLWNARVQP